MNINYTIKCKNINEISKIVIDTNKKIYIMIEEINGHIMLHNSVHSLEEILLFVQNDSLLIIQPVDNITNSLIDYLNNLLYFYDFYIVVRSEKDGQQLYIKNMNFKIGLIEDKILEINDNSFIFTFFIIFSHYSIIQNHF